MHCHHAFGLLQQALTYEHVIQIVPGQERLAGFPPSLNKPWLFNLEIYLVLW